ncbi:MAG TPA: hypothetical protein VH988_08410 [Thermoanaerobaculia bacterium]|nr:hypothetical protein [Thermoanaerobaculia bacterium]
MNKANITYHGGATITSAKVVYLFWGSAFCFGGADHAYATTLQAYRNQLGTTPEYAVITQYSGILASNLGTGTADLFDCSNPPVNVTDAIAQSEVNLYLAFYPFDASTIYEVVLPSASYSTAGGASSCGGPNLKYCAYHSWITNVGSTTKYSVQPYPSCGGCKTAGWTNVQNQEHFVCHETREAVTDPDGNGWWEPVGVNMNEADDKCNWAPAPFIGTGGYSYQWEWSNAFSACRKTLP